MRNLISVRISIWLALLLMLVTAHSVLAFDPPTWPDGLPWGLPTAMPWPTARPLGVGESWSPLIPGAPVFTPTPTPTPIVAKPVAPIVPVAPVVVSPPNIPVVIVTPIPAPIVQQPSTNPSTNPLAIMTGGNSPLTPLDATGAWLVLDAGASVWYRIGSGGVQMEVFLDADTVNNVALSIYSPGQLGKPVGKGTPYTKDNSRLYWNGGHWNADGDWLAQVTNYNPMAIHYRVTSSARDISNKSCHGYWERIGSNPYPIFWTICE